MNDPTMPKPAPFELPPDRSDYESDAEWEGEEEDDWVTPGGTSEDWE